MCGLTFVEHMYKGWGKICQLPLKSIMNPGITQNYLTLNISAGALQLASKIKISEKNFFSDQQNWFCLRE